MISFFLISGGGGGEVAPCDSNHRRTPNNFVTPNFTQATSISLDAKEARTQHIQPRHYHVPNREAPSRAIAGASQSRSVKCGSFGLPATNANRAVSYAPPRFHLSMNLAYDLQTIAVHVNNVNKFLKRTRNIREHFLSCKIYRGAS